MSFIDLSVHRHTGFQLDELAYRSRQALIAAKKLLGLSIRSNKTFFVDRFHRALCNGTMGSNVCVMSLGKDDGAGSQAQAAMSAICFARAHGLSYIHRPFTAIQHAETDMPSWARTWEEYFNLGAGERQFPDEHTLPVIHLENLAIAPCSCPTIVATEHYLRFCNRDPHSWERVLPELREMFWRNKTAPAKSGEIRIAVHMRRGDVSAHDKKVARNFTPNATFVRTLEQLKALVGGRTPLRIEIFSQGTPEMFADLTALGATLRLNDPALDTHRSLVEADILVMSKGAFSYTAGLLNEGIVLYDPQKYRPIDDWVVRRADGEFDAAPMECRLHALITRS